jgi:tetratricopeptide (TPR) repeat protein
MQKAQVIVVVVAVVSIIGLAFLPKSVVDSDNKSLGGANRDVQAPQAQLAKPDSSVVSLHQAELGPEQKAQLAKWRAAFLAVQPGPAQKQAYDSLAACLRAANLYDSVAHYAAQLAGASPNSANYLLAGDAHYEAFTFAVDNAKSRAHSAQAREWYQKILDRDSTRADVKVKLGMTYVASDTPMRGIQLIKQVLAEDPNNQFALLNFGLLLMQSGQMDKAKARFEQLLQLDPKDTKAMFYLAVTQAELGQTAEARKLFGQVRKLDQDPALRLSIDNYLKELNGRKP